MSNPPGGCADFHRSLQIDRRSFLKAGILGSAGLSLAELLRAEAQAGAGTSIRSVIILWMRGGPSHIDMWDPKPNAPAEYRGEFGVLSTRVPGIALCDLLPLCGQIMPIPRRRRPFRRRPDLFHRLSRWPESGCEHSSNLRLDHFKTTG